MDLVVGLDSGTTATKAVAVAADATVIATSSVGYPLLVPHPGYAELDSVGLQKAAVEAVAEVATQVRQRGDPGSRALSQRGDARAGPDGRRRRTNRSAGHLGGQPCSAGVAQPGRELAWAVAQTDGYAGPSDVSASQAAVVADASPRRLRRNPQVGRCQGGGAVRVVRGRVSDRLVMCLNHRPLRHH